MLIILLLLLYNIFVVVKLGKIVIFSVLVCCVSQWVILFRLMMQLFLLWKYFGSSVLGVLCDLVLFRNRNLLWVIFCFSGVLCLVQFGNSLVSVCGFIMVLDSMCVFGLEFFFSMYIDSLWLVLSVCWCRWIVVVRLVGLVLMIIMLNFIILCGGRVLVLVFIDCMICGQGWYWGYWWCLGIVCVVMGEMVV